MRPDAPLSRLLSGLLQNLGRELEPRSGVRLSPEFGQTLLGFVAATYADDVAPAIGRGARAKAKAYRAYVESRLTESDLRPAHIAAHFRISERYLRQVLSTEGESFQSYLLRLRLSRCARLLRDSQCTNRTITQIALQSGFVNPTHFGSAFKRRYGITPRQFRAGGATAPGHGVVG